MASLLGKIASIFVEIRAPNSQLQSDLRSAEGQVQSSAQRMGQAASNAGRGSVGFAAGLKEATKPARDIVGSLSGAVGIISRSIGLVGIVTGAVYALYKGVEYVATATERARVRANALRQELESFRFSKLPEIKFDTSSITKIDDAISELEKRRADAIKEALKLASSSDLGKTLSDQVRNAQPGAGDFDYVNGKLVQSVESRKRQADAEARLAEFRALTEKDANREISAQIESLQKERSEKLDEAVNDYAEFRRSLKEIEGSGRIGDLAGGDIGIQFGESAIDRANKFREAVKKIYDDFEEGEKKRIEYQQRYMDMVRSQHEAEEKRRLDAIEREANAAINAAQRTRSSIDSIFSSGGPESYAAQRIDGALSAIQEQLATIAFGTEPRF